VYSPEFPCAQPQDRVEYDDDERDELPPIPVIQRPQCIGARSRSFFLIDDRYKLVVLQAAAEVRRYTLFENPMLNADGVAQLLLQSWNNAQRDCGQDLDCTKTINSHVSHSARKPP